MFLANTYGIQNQTAVCGPGFTGAPFLGFLGGLSSSLVGQMPGCPSYGGCCVPPGQAAAGLGQYASGDREFACYLNRTFNPPFCGFPSYGCPPYGGGGRCVVLQPCSGNLSNYQNVANNAFGGCQPQGAPSDFCCSYGPPANAYGCGQVFGGQHWGRPQVIEVHHYYHNCPQPPAPPQPPVSHCPPPPAPPVPHCPPPPPPVCQPQPPVCPPPAPPVCQPEPPVCPPPPPAPPAPPVATPVVQAPPGDPHKVTAFAAVDENWLDGSRGWGRPSEMVASRLVGGTPAQQAEIHFSGQNPDAPGPSRSERLTVWRCLQGDNRLRYSLEDKTFFLTNQTGQHFPVMSLNDPLLAGMPNTSGNALQPIWTQLGARCNAVENQISGNNNLPVAAEPVVPRPNPMDVWGGGSFFPQTPRLFG